MKIGFFDSGVGGLTVLKEALSKINCEYIYLADNANAPYGIKKKEDVKKYIAKCIDYLVKRECEIIVIACNTATSLSIVDMRKKYPNIFIIGTEPAVKVAADDIHNRILVCATSITISEEKLKKLIETLNINDKVDLVAADKLVTFAESNNFTKNDIENYLKSIIDNKRIKEYSHVVLGCTHFPLFKENFKDLFGENIKVIDGNIGIVNNLINKLRLKGFNFNNKNSTVEIVISKNDNTFVNNAIRILGKEDIKITIINN